jgi:hypothetical protein
MRNFKRTGVLAALIATALLTGACAVSDDQAPKTQRIAAAKPQAKASAKAGPSKAAKLVKPKFVRPAAKAAAKRAAAATVAPQPATTETKQDVALRQFCDLRHINFQAGRFIEQPGEMAANNELCKQVYSTGSITPAPAADADKPK